MEKEPVIKKMICFDVKESCSDSEDIKKVGSKLKNQKGEETALSNVDLVLFISRYCG